MEGPPNEQSHAANAISQIFALFYRSCPIGVLSLVICSAPERSIDPIPLPAPRSPFPNLLGPFTTRSHLISISHRTQQQTMWPSASARSPTLPLPPHSSPIGSSWGGRRQKADGHSACVGGASTHTCTKINNTSPHLYYYHAPLPTLPTRRGPHTVEI